MDKGVINLVSYFNSVGLKTKMSCEGHWPEQPNKGMFWISFDKSVTELDICNFINKHSPSNYYIGYGWFVLRLINSEWKEWRYIAPNKEIAEIDYQQFLSNE